MTSIFFINILMIFTHQASIIKIQLFILMIQTRKVGY